MNPSVTFICLVLAFVAFTETDAVRNGWASGAIGDRDPENPNIRPEGQQKYTSHYKVEGQSADAAASGDNINVYTQTSKKGAISQSFASASGSNRASSVAIAGK